MPVSERRNSPAAPIDSASPAPSSDSPSTSFSDQLGNVVVILDKANGLTEGADLLRLVVAGALTQDTLKELVLVDQPINLGDRLLDGRARHVAHGRPEQHLHVLLANRLDTAPEVAREDEIVVVDDVLRQRHAH